MENYVGLPAHLRHHRQTTGHPRKRDDHPDFWDDFGYQLQERKKAQNESMPRFWLSELFGPADSELATRSLSLEEFVAATGGMPSDVDKREHDRRARIQNIEEDDAVF